MIGTGKGRDRMNYVTLSNTSFWIFSYWDTDEPLCNIAPPPFGDDIVDVGDLKVLAEHLFEESGLVAHWKLDETESNIAYDSARTNDADVLGDPAWQPDNLCRKNN